MPSVEESSNLSFHFITDTASECYRMLIIWIFVVFPWTGNRYDGGFSLEGEVSQILLKTIRRH